MANELTIPSKSFLKVPCKHYLETMISSYDVLRSELRKHLPFIIYWSECIETKPSASNAMYYAFAYYNKLDNNSIDEVSEKKADDYLEALIRYYNSEYPDNVFGKHIAQFIRGFKSNTRKEEINSDDFEWFPRDKNGNEKLPKEFEQISKEFDFAWKCARLWHLLKKREQEHYILNFLGISETEFAKTSNIPPEISSRLNETTIEDPKYLKQIVDYFSPEQMTKHDMCLLLKKACRASIKKQLNDEIIEINPSNARIKPLDSLWLLARFYGLHHYRLNFIRQKMPVRAIKQFSGIDEESPFLDWNEKNLEKLIRQETVTIGNRDYPLTEVLMTMYGHKQLLSFFEHKSNEIIPGKERNRYEPIYQSIREQSSSFSAISNFDLTNEKVRKFVKEHQSVCKAMIFLGSLFNTKYLALLEKYSSIIEKKANSKILDNFIVGTMITEGLENAKNVFFITEDDFNNWDLLGAALIWLLLYFKAVEKVASKQEPKQIETSS